MNTDAMRKIARSDRPRASLQVFAIRAADEIDDLREALVRYGNRMSMSNARPELQRAIDAAFEANGMAKSSHVKNGA